MKELSKQDQEFAKEVAITGNQTQSAKKAYGIENDGYARVKGHKQLTKDNIVKAVEEVKKTLAEQIDQGKLLEVLNEGLEATKKIFKNNNESGDIDMVSEEPDHAVRHKYLDSGLKIVGAYAPEKSINLDVNVDITNPKAMELATKYEEELKQNL